MDETRAQTRRLVVIWAVLSVLGVLGVVFLLGPHMPPGRASAEASDQTTTNILVAAIMLPIAIAVWVFFAYALRTFRQRGERIEDGPPITGNTRIQTAWIVSTILIVLFLAAFGSYSLLGTAEGAGGGQGSNPLVKPPGTALQVQVIGQQWNWTFRYPDSGAFETTHLVLPADQLVELHVTSLDVIHSFWAYQLGVKADAVPGTDNAVYVTPRKVGAFEIRCAELCGLWHGDMNTHGAVVTAAAFQTWLKQERIAYAPGRRGLPPYSSVYYPDPQRRAG